MTAGKRKARALEESPKNDLVGRWVHLYEEDGSEGDVYLRDTADIPLSRRPRERLEFCANGTATLSEAGPDDRTREQRAAWRVEAGVVVVRLERGLKGAREVRVLRMDRERIVIRREGT